MSKPAVSILVSVSLALLVHPAGALPEKSVEEVSAVLAHIPAADREILFEQGEVIRYHSNRDAFALVPNAVVLEKVQSELDSIRANVGVEVLFVEPMNSDYGRPLNMMNLLLSISTMAGIEYFSESRGQMRVLFEQSHLIDTPDGMNRVSDPVVDTLPRDIHAYAFQEDTTFGKSVIRITFHGEEREVWLESENLTPYRYLMIPIIRRRQMRLWVFVYPGDGFLLFYGSFGAHAGSLSLFESRIQKSFYNRLVALHGWYMARLAESMER